MSTRAFRGAGLFVAATLMLAAAGGVVAGAASKSTPTTALKQGPATQQVTSAFVTLFNANDKNEKARAALIEDPAVYKSKFIKLFSSTVAKANPTVAKVTAVTFPGSSACKAAVKVPVCAAVTYDLETATTGSALLTDQSGYAVYVGGHWLVSDASFCALAKLAGASC
jgi:hypothetical protein